VIRGKTFAASARALAPGAAMTSILVASNGTQSVG
jgi:hypothetical protein